MRLAWGTQILTSKNIPASACTLGARFGELVGGCDGSAEAHPEHKFLMMSRITRTFSADLADCQFGSSCSMPTLVSSPERRDLWREAGEAATDAATSKLATTGDRTQIHRCTSPPQEIRSKRSSISMSLSCAVKQMR